MTTLGSERSPTPERLSEAIAEMRARGRAGAKMMAFNEALIAEFRATGGESMGGLSSDIVALITMTGARSGTDRTVPLGVFEIDGKLVLVATQGGLPTHPQWYYNLIANPMVLVERRRERFHARAIALAGSARDGIVRKLPDVPFEEYLQHTGDRTIPIFELRRLDDGLPSSGRLGYGRAGTDR